jgi:uncharacterized membrane protein
MFNFIYDFLNRMGYPHPIHPTEVHMPIGLIVGALVFALVARFAKRPALTKCAYSCVILAFIWIFPTMLFGFMDWQHFYAGAWLFPIKMKLILFSALAVFLLFTVALGRKVGTEARSVLAMYALCFVTVVGLGYFGGQLVYGGGRTPPAPDQFKAGEALFKENCSSCHPQGGNIIDPNLPLKQARQLADFETFVAFTRKPTMPDGSPGIMPPFPSAKLSEQQGKQLYQYITKVLEKR